MKHGRSLICSLALAGVVCGAALAEADPCAETICRPSKIVLLTIPSSGVAVVMAEKAPIVDSEGKLMILPGEVLVLRFEADAAGAGRLTVIEDRTPPPVDTYTPPGGTEALPLYSSDITVMEDMAVPMKGLPPNSIIMTYGQMPGKPDTVLTISHNVGGMLAYKALAGFWSEKGYGFKETSTCTVISEKFGVEHWPQPIGPMILTDFVREAEGDMRCE